ncbi:MAG TPA: hypothetical protein DDW55_06940 [Gammaproteobacteria bacterium]|nr:hypothetical protein [Gammaproteobacteria bacterium]
MTNIPEEKKLELTRGIIRMLDQFGLDAEQQIKVLGFPEGTRTRTLRQHREHKAFPDDPQIQERVSILLHINDALRTTYPTNPQMALFWVRKKNRHLDNATPVEVMSRGSRNDLIDVLSQLDCTVHWDMASAKN